MKMMLCHETDETLYDWFSILRGKPTIFGTKPPKWLRTTLQGQWQKRRDLLEALYERVMVLIFRRPLSFLMVLTIGFLAFFITPP